ncbi:hypothetical protein NEOLI_002228 [Neolecta irregularis DAH-3]|uniref:Retrotransposon gag domain-containing protein n=1 Tax=Neolecta irregularis (strain DAH-3) TaxID=1198029 RepID=A0A1U7LRN7_NEOID|nr:hypothetical protein NEOLI_002228 [Neolecta irregularis DAH-3]|eukprot:OLL25212.1 hypothetical protein NEOLI_002228 [Neolecta irregularis DAH-3]
MSISDIVPFNGIGTDESISAGRWITQIEIVCSLIEGVNREPSVRFFLHLLNSKLIRNAAEWADENPAIQDILRKVDPGTEDRQRFCQMFVERFTLEKTDVVEELDRLRQIEGERLYDYYRRVEILAFRAGAMDERPHWKEHGVSQRFVRKQIIFRFIIGLLDEQVSKELLRAKVKSLRKIYELAKDVQMMNRIIAKRFPPQPRIEPRPESPDILVREEPEKQPSPISSSTKNVNFQSAESSKSLEVSKVEISIEPHPEPTAEPSESPEWKIPFASHLPVRAVPSVPDDPFTASPAKPNVSVSPKGIKKTPHRRIDFVKEKSLKLRPVRPGNPSPSRASRFAIKKSIDSKDGKAGRT